LPVERHDLKLPANNIRYRSVTAQGLLLGVLQHPRIEVNGQG